MPRQQTRTSRRKQTKPLQPEGSQGQSPRQIRTARAGWHWLAHPWTIFGLVLLFGLLCRFIWLPRPDHLVIFDEIYYVPAAKVILGQPVSRQLYTGLPIAPSGNYIGRPKGLDPNHEHPPLGKILIAGSIRLFGDNAYGWRIPSEVAGLAAILLVFAIVRAVDADPWLAVLGAALFTFDNLALVHSRIATLDMMLVAFLLLSAWLLLRRQPLLAGIACALGALVKLVGVYGLLALVLYEVGLMLSTWNREGTWDRTHLRTAGLTLLGFVPVALGGLWLLDLAFTPYRTPWEHLGIMLHYGVTLHHPGGELGADESYPWQWLANDVQMIYRYVSHSIPGTEVGTVIHYDILFRGAMNPFIIGAAPLGVGWAAFRAWRDGDRLSIWVLAWVAGNYLPYYPLALLSHRVSYIYYFLPTLPAVCVAIAQMLRQLSLPRLVVGSYLAAVLVGLYDYFPFRSIF